MREEPDRDDAGALLAVAYPKRRERQTAIRWLGWIAYQVERDGVAVQDVSGKMPGMWAGWSRIISLSVMAMLILMLLLSWFVFILFTIPLLLVFLLLKPLGKDPFMMLDRAQDKAIDSVVGLARDWRFRWLLRSAAARQVLVVVPGGYEFRDPRLRAALADHHDAALHAQPEPGVARALGLLQHAHHHSRRIRVDAAATFAVCVAAIWPYGDNTGWRSRLSGWVLLAILFGGVFGIRNVIRFGRWAAPRVTVPPRPSPTAAKTAAVLAVTVLAVLIVSLSPVRSAVLTAVLPSLIVVVFGVRVFLPARRAASRWRAARSPLRFVPDVVAVVTIGLADAVFGNLPVLTRGPAGPLLALAVGWEAIGIWRAMKGSRRIVSKAAADLVLSLLLGADLVLSIVWLGNLLNLSRPEITFLRTVGAKIGSLADLPWWTWTSAYLLLALAAIAVGRWPRRLRPAARISERLHVVSGVTGTKRVLTGMHIGLLSLIFIGAVAPVAVKPLLRSQLSTRYTLELQRELAAVGAAAVYRQIEDDVTSDEVSGSTLVRIVHGVSGSGDVPHNDLAHYLGSLQAQSLKLPPRETPQAAPPPGLREGLRTLDAEEQAADAASARAQRIGDYTAAGLAQMMSLPDVGNNEIVQIVREYLGGLVEEGPLKETLAAWARHVPGARPPAPGEIVLPNATRLEQQALTSARTEGITIDSDALDGKQPADGAVDVARETAAACGTCGHIGSEPHDVPEEPPGEGILDIFK